MLAENTLRVANPAPDFELPAPIVESDGARIRSIGGKVTLVAFTLPGWRPAMPHRSRALNRLLDRMRHSRGGVLGRGGYRGAGQVNGQEGLDPVLRITDDS